MNQSQSVQHRHIHPYTLGLGLFSVICGGAMLLAPRASGSLYAMPRSRTLLRLLGARDVLIGSALLFPATRSLGLALRSLADASDGTLIACEIVRSPSSALRGGVSLALAALSATSAMRLLFREGRSPLADRFQAS